MLLIGAWLLYCKSKIWHFRFFFSCENMIDDRCKIWIILFSSRIKESFHNIFEFYSPQLNNVVTFSALSIKRQHVIACKFIFLFIFLNQPSLLLSCCAFLIRNVKQQWQSFFYFFPDRQSAKWQKQKLCFINRSAYEMVWQKLCGRKTS